MGISTKSAVAPKLKRAAAGGALAVAMAVTGTVAPSMISEQTVASAQAQTHKAPRLGFIADRAVTVGERMTDIRVLVFDGHNNKVTVSGLPSWAKYDAAKGAIVGTASSTGTWYPVVTVTDSYGRVDQGYPMIMSVPKSMADGHTPPTNSWTPPTSAGDTTAPKMDSIATINSKRFNTISSVQVTSDDPRATYSSSDLPLGLNISRQGLITGMPFFVGSSTYTVKATDQAGNTSTIKGTVNVAR